MNTELIKKRCESCEGIGQALNADQIINLMPQLDKNWQVSHDKKSIHRAYTFNNFYETMGFVNAVAFIANLENHHPDLEIGYNYCNIKFMTHALKGLSQNDFICAAKVDALSY